MHGWVRECADAARGDGHLEAPAKDLLHGDRRRGRAIPAIRLGHGGDFPGEHEFLNRDKCSPGDTATNTSPSRVGGIDKEGGKKVRFQTCRAVFVL